MDVCESVYVLIIYSRGGELRCYERGSCKEDWVTGLDVVIQNIHPGGTGMAARHHVVSTRQCEEGTTAMVCDILI